MDRVANGLFSQSIIEYEALKGLRSTKNDSSNTPKLPKGKSMHQTTSLGDIALQSPGRFLNPMDEFLGKTAELDESRPYIPAATATICDSITSTNQLAGRVPRTPSRSLINYIPTLQVQPRMPSLYLRRKGKHSYISE